MHLLKEDSGRADRVGGVDNDGIVCALWGLLHKFDAVRKFGGDSCIIVTHRHLHKKLR